MIEGLEGFQEPVLNPTLIPILESNKTSGFDFMFWIVYPLVILIFLILIIIIIIVVVKKIKANALPEDFKLLIKNGEQAIRNKDFNSAEKIYNQMKKKSEDNQNKKMASASLDLYKKIIDMKRNL